MAASIVGTARIATIAEILRTCPSSSGPSATARARGDAGDLPLALSLLQAGRLALDRGAGADGEQGISATRSDAADALVREARRLPRHERRLHLLQDRGGRAALGDRPGG